MDAVYSSETIKDNTWRRNQEDHIPNFYRRQNVKAATENGDSWDRRGSLSAKWTQPH
jgi:hypothetical protein